jgi:hypothetical protein
VKCTRITRSGSGKYQRAAFLQLGLTKPSKCIGPCFYKTV